MDSGTLHRDILQNPRLITSFAGVWSAKNFPKQPAWSKTRRQKNILYPRPRLVWFQIINTSPACALGKHWLLLGAVVTKQSIIRVFIWDCLGQPLSHYKIFAQRLRLLYRETGILTINFDAKLKHFAEVEIVRFMNCQYKTYFRYNVV